MTYVATLVCVIVHIIVWGIALVQSLISALHIVMTLLVSRFWHGKTPRVAWIVRSTKHHITVRDTYTPVCEVRISLQARMFI